MQNPRSVYIHIPFCRHRCGYCNFTLVAGKNHLIGPFLQALEIEIAQVEGRPEVDTIYLGGGTPSQLTPNDFEYLLKLIDQRFQLAEDVEFTMEANPEDLPGEIATIIKQSPVNRVSLGIQSFHQPKLRSLDRPHTTAEIETALESCRDLVDRFSVDLIFAAPHDSPEIWNEDLRQAVASGAGHISTYELTFEPGTRFGTDFSKGRLSQKDEDVRADLYQKTIDQLTGNGFSQYEVSSFAKPGESSRHNQVYWNGAPWFGFGPGASGMVGNFRYTNHRSVVKYIDLVLLGETAIEESQLLSHFDLAIDRLTFGLRMIEGIDRNRFRSRFEIDAADLIPRDFLATCIEQELILLEPNRIALSRQGVFVADEICATIQKHHA